MDGIFIIDKPSGPTSHDICEFFKRELGFQKVGHAGTLDPLATGVLIILTGSTTKLQSVFMGKEKEYKFTIRLGIATDTYDSEGKVVQEAPVPSDALEQIQNMLQEFRGEILQTPPAYSALKKNGKPLYKLAREGKEVKPEPRKITIYSLEIVRTYFMTPSPLVGEGGGEGEITLKARCSSGTYVRSIAHDIGQKLGCGAHITALRRLRSEPFGVEDACPLF